MNCPQAFTFTMAACLSVIAVPLYRESLLATMANRTLLLEPGDLGALVHYYSSNRATD